MKKYFSTEIIIGVCVLLVMVIVGFYAFNQRNKIKKIEHLKQIEFASVDSLQRIVKEANTKFSDSIKFFDNEIERIKNELNEANSPKYNAEEFQKLENLIEQSKYLVFENKRFMTKMMKEPPVYEYTPTFFLEFIGALIQNIELKEKQIADLEFRIKELEIDLDIQRQINAEVINDKIDLSDQNTVLKGNLNSAQEKLHEKQQQISKLLTFHYIIGNQRELLKEKVLTKKLLGSECFMANDISEGRFTSQSYGENATEINLGKIGGKNVKVSPELRGATFSVSSDGKLLLKVTNPVALANTRFVFYY